MSDSSIVYGCAQSYLSSLADQHCGYLSSKIPDCGFTDAACCTTAYGFMTEEAKCLSPYATCMDYTSWIQDGSIGLAACTAALASITLTDSTAVPTSGSNLPGTKAASSPTITLGPTVTGSASAVNTQTTATKNAGERVQIGLFTVGVFGFVGLSALLGAWGGL
ncbi:hypothetical protein BKA65DRAFT_535769 [Rhexocercosporidium sp. MPI-PUGE-AT-0058]|nr:hypothetical protein BKA65DRAFT_535769 [Rhexocercosporidium sp. MPI-PUGE-AT-0058]